MFIGTRTGTRMVLGVYIGDCTRRYGRSIGFFFYMFSYGSFKLVSRTRVLEIVVCVPHGGGIYR